MAQRVSGIRDNHSRSGVGDHLHVAIWPGCRLPVSSAFFNVCAYDLPKDEPDTDEHTDFLFGEPRFTVRLDPERLGPDGSRRGNLDARE